MNIHQVFIIPGYGHFGDEYSQGKHNGRISELDVIDIYVSTMVDELDSEGVRHTVVKTRGAPGLSLAQRVQAVEPNSLVLHCLGGWMDKRKVFTKNVTCLYYGNPGSFAIADEMGDAVGQWGHCYVHGHKTSNPKLLEQDPLLNIPETKAIAIEPFALNGPDSQEYLKRLEALGKVVARALSDHLGQRGQAKIYGNGPRPLALV